MSGALMLDEPVADLTQLDRALAKLWQTAHEHGRRDEEPLNRALTMNFIGVFDGTGETDADEILARLSVRHPSRAFVLHLDPTAAGITATVSADIRQAGKGRVMILEKIDLTLPPHELVQLPGLIRPLLVNDIPVHLFWSAQIPENEQRLLLLADLADQTTIDSSEFDQPVRDLERCKGLPDVRMLDLAHFRLAPWRRAIAEAFEQLEWQPTPVTTVRIAHRPEPGALAASHTLARWLEEKLHADVRLEVTHDMAPTHEPLALDLQWGSAQVHVQHLVKEPMLRVVVTLLDVCMLPFTRPASRGNQGDLLAAAVDSV